MLAVAARSPADERSLMRDTEDVTTVELRVAESPVGQLRMRTREGTPDGAVLRLVTTLIASEVERVRAPERASEEAATSFQRAVLTPRDRRPRRPAGPRQGARHRPVGGGERRRRARPSPQSHRGRLAPPPARRGRPRRPFDRRGLDRRAIESDAGEVVLLIPDADGETGRRVAGAVMREVEAGLSGFAFALGRSRRVEDPLDLQRAFNEALLALNVVEGDAERTQMGYEETGTYQLLLPYMSDPAELKRFYNETVRPLVSYDEQYETDLLGTLATFLDCDANVNATASRLITHRHTIRYRFERVRELTGLDVSSTDGREKLSLGLKAMRVLGIAAPRGPATEPGAGGGRVRH